MRSPGVDFIQDDETQVTKDMSIDKLGTIEVTVRRVASARDVPSNDSYCNMIAEGAVHELSKKAGWHRAR